MDFQKFVDSFSSPTCVVSVRKFEDGGYGEIRLVAGNKKYTDMIDLRVRNDSSDGQTEGTAFVSGKLYTDYFPQNKSFDEVCYQAAVLKKNVHTYAHISNVDIWFDIYTMPMDYEEGDICYCTYTSSPTKNPDALLDSVNTSQTSNDVLKTCIKLHKASNLEEALESVISEIRRICKAEGCTVLLLNHEEERFSILATNYVPDSSIKRVTEFEGFYDIANSWMDMIGDEGDCIIIRNEEDMEHISKINHPWYVTLVEAGVKSVVLFPLRQGNEILGFIWAINFDTENTMRIKETLELTTFFTSSHIARYKVLKRLEKMSYIDALTGLPNHFACTEYISNLIESGKKCVAVSIDINNFKRINDTLGFEVGSKVLLEVTERWKAITADESLKTVRYLTRIGGDEFFLVVSGYDTEEELKNTIQSYVNAIGDNLILDGCDLYVSASFGYAEYPSDADSRDALVSHANAAMNELKKVNSSEHVLRFTSASI